MSDDLKRTLEKLPEWKRQLPRNIEQEIPDDRSWLRRCSMLIAAVGELQRERSKMLEIVGDDAPLQPPITAHMREERPVPAELRGMLDAWQRVIESTSENDRSEEWNAGFVEATRACKANLEAHLSAISAHIEQRLEAELAAWHEGLVSRLESRIDGICDNAARGYQISVRAFRAAIEYIDSLTPRKDALAALLEKARIGERRRIAATVRADRASLLKQLEELEAEMRRKAEFSSHSRTAACNRSWANRLRTIIEGAQPQPPKRKEKR